MLYPGRSFAFTHILEAEFEILHCSSLADALLHSTLGKVLAQDLKKMVFHSLPLYILESL